MLLFGYSWKIFNLALRVGMVYSQMTGSMPSDHTYLAGHFIMVSQYHSFTQDGVMSLFWLVEMHFEEKEHLTSDKRCNVETCQCGNKLVLTWYTKSRVRF